MSQQEFFQQPEGSERERQTSSYHVPGRGGRKSGMPKDEPVGDDDFAMLHGYRAREYGPQEQEHAAPFSEEHAHTGRTREEQSVPAWARPQKNNSRGVLIVLLIIAGLILIKPLLIVGGILLALLGATIGIVLFAIIFPLLLLVIILACVLLAMRVAFGSAFRPRRFYDRRYWRRYRRGYRW
ncbi:MAG TPA: hypothetical protein VKV40_02495 [Ktedonobacteraceae bacterium]|nr:hypothetical protein [Ktedonobacteraceae bacterium]